MRVKWFAPLLSAFVPIFGWSLIYAQTVKITPLGYHAGELCPDDRALLFEDPTGVRVLYDAGRTVAGGSDPRLGDVHVVLLSHAHGDHDQGAALLQSRYGAKVVMGAPDWESTLQRP